MSQLDDPLESAVRAFLAAVPQPDEPNRAAIAAANDLERTPARVASLWRSNLLSGYALDPGAELGEPIPDTAGAVVALTGIPFHSVCPHHLLPYSGEAHVAYAPAGRIVGFGGIERLVAALSRRLILQEDLTRSIAEALAEHLAAAGAACAIEATHGCLVLQGREPRSARCHTRFARGTLEGRPEVLPPVRAAP